MTYPIFWVPSPKYTAGRGGLEVIALVHHRMVGTLRGTDSAFTVGTRDASTHFGVGYGCGKSGHPATAPHIHQYVNIDDQAWGNGNWSTSGAWDDRYPTSFINARTVSIEHHDNGQLDAGDARRGVVPENVLQASMWLGKLLLSGDLAAWKTAGIGFRSATLAADVARQLKLVVPGPHTIIDHHYISGTLKPSCWRPWAADAVGFPQARFIEALRRDQDMLVVANATLLQGGARAWRVPAGTTLSAYDPARPGAAVATTTFSAAYSALCDAEVFVSYPGTTTPPVPRGGPFLRVTSGGFAGLLIVKAQVALDAAPPPDCAEAVATAVKPLEARIAAAKAALG